MNPNSCDTRPAVRANDIEWAFTDGQPAIVAHIPNGEGDYIVVRLDQTAPDRLYEREHVKALLRIAARVMADSEPTTTSEVAR